MANVMAVTTREKQQAMKSLLLLALVVISYGFKSKTKKVLYNNEISNLKQEKVRFACNGFE
jgi:hypothetical protein